MFDYRRVVADNVPGGLCVLAQFCVFSTYGMGWRGGVGCINVLTPPALGGVGRINVLTELGES